MKPLIQSLVQIIDRRAARGDLSYWSPEAVSRLRALAGPGELTEHSLPEAAAALADFRPQPAAAFSESSASLLGIASIITAFLEQAKSLSSPLFIAVRAVAERLCEIGTHVEKLERLLDVKRIEFRVA
jgi:hypothetical protein